METEGRVGTMNDVAAAVDLPEEQVEHIGKAGLEVLNSDGGTKSVHALTCECTFLGRGVAGTNGIEISGTGVSFVHCRVTVKEGECTIVNESDNGTYVNEEKIQRAALHDGDTISIGDVRVCFHGDVSALRGHVREEVPAARRPARPEIVVPAEGMSGVDAKKPPSPIDETDEPAAKPRRAVLSLKRARHGVSDARGEGDSTGASRVELPLGEEKGAEDHQESDASSPVSDGGAVEEQQPADDKDIEIFLDTAELTAAEEAGPGAGTGAGIDEDSIKKPPERGPVPPRTAKLVKDFITACTALRMATEDGQPQQVTMHLGAEVERIIGTALQEGVLDEFLVLLAKEGDECSQFMAQRWVEDHKGAQ